eukprot:scaffold220977_cov32-Prasinocladus_malaysianus.AAC.2
MSPSRTPPKTEKQAAKDARPSRQTDCTTSPPDGMMRPSRPSAIDYLSPNIAIGTDRGLSSAVRHLQLF